MVSTIARGLFGAYFTYAEVDMMWRSWLTGDASDSGLADDEDAPGDWFIGQASAWGLEAGLGGWTGDQADSEELYFVHIPDAPVLEGTAADIAAASAELVGLDISALERFCAEVLRLTTPPVPEYRALKVLE